MDLLVQIIVGDARWVTAVDVTGKGGTGSTTYVVFTKLGSSSFTFHH